MPSTKRPPISPDIHRAADQIAEDITHSLICNLFGSPLQASQEIAKMKAARKKLSPFLVKAAEWTQKYLNEHKEEASMAAVQQATGVPNSPGLLDPYTFPGVAPAPDGQTYQFPGNVPCPTPAPGDPAAQTQDESTLTKNAPASDYRAPGDQTGTPPSSDSTAHEEQVRETFPGEANPGGGAPYTGPEHSGFSPKVPLGPQGPENERHNPYQHNTREGRPGGPSNYSANRAPWENHASFKADDGHAEAVQKTGMEVDLFARRFAKRKDIADLTKQAEKFRAERDCMGTLTSCAAHVDEDISYSKEVFAYNYGQVRRNLSQAIRNFANTDEEPDMETYHSLMAMRSDLLGESSSKFFAESQPLLQIAMAGFGDEDEKDDKDPKDPDSEEAMFGGGCDKDEEEDDMKEADVTEAVAISLSMRDHGHNLTAENLATSIVELAKMTGEARRSFAKLAGLLDPTPTPTTEAPAPQGSSANRTSALVAELNMAQNGSRKDIHEQAGKSQPLQAQNFGVFMAKEKSPIFQGNFKQ